MELKRKKVGLFTLGITLILVGVIILLNQYTQYEVFRDYYLLWPAFLIMLGLEFIITKIYYDMKKQDVQLAPSVLSILLVIVILFTSVVWSNVSVAGPWRMNLNWNNNWRSISYSHQIRETLDPQTLSLAGTTQVDIKNYRGYIHIEPWDQDTLEVTTQVIVDTNHSEQAAELLGDILHLTGGNTAAVTVRNPYGNDHQLNAVNMTIRLPKEINLVLETRFGEINVTEISGNVSAKQEHSSVEISNIIGNVTVSNRHGRIRIKNVDGDANVVNAHGEVTLEDITGSLKTENSYQATRILNIGGNAEIESRHGQVRLENVSGNVRLENEYNSTFCTNVSGDLNIRSRHGAVNLETIAGHVTVDNSYGSIRLTNGSYAQADIHAETSYSRIYPDQGVGMQVEEETNFQSGSAVNGSGSQNIRLKNRHGEIRIEVR